MDLPNDKLPIPPGKAADAPASLSAVDNVLQNTLHVLAKRTGKLNETPIGQYDIFAQHSHAGERDSYYLTRHNNSLRVSKTAEDAIRATTYIKDSVIAVRGSEIFTKEDDINKLNMRAALSRRAGEADAQCIGLALNQPIPTGLPIASGVLLIDNAQTPVILRLAGDKTTHQKSMHVVATGPLLVDMSNTPPDRYSDQPMTIRTTGGTSDITIKVDSEWEQQFLNCECPTYSKGIMADKDGKVTGVQMHDKGIIIMLQPGQKLNVLVEKKSMPGFDIFSGREVLNVYAAHPMVITGGQDKDQTSVDLKRQNSQRPVQEFVIPEPVAPPVLVPTERFAGAGLAKINQGKQGI